MDQPIDTPFVERFNADGSPDPGFASGQPAFLSRGGDSTTWGGMALNVGDIIVAGVVHTPSGPEIGLAALESDGTLDLGGITGSGLINGLPFAVAVAAAPAGQVRFRLAAKYVGNRTVPQGQSVFQFPATRRVFRSTALDWLVVSGNTALFQGSGTINGAGS
jgi:hypothetical protein